MKGARGGWDRVVREVEVIPISRMVERTKRAGTKELDEGGRGQKRGMRSRARGGMEKGEK